MTTLKSKFMDGYIDYESDACILLSTILFPLTCGFSDISEIVDSKACLYAYIYTNHYYTVYYRKLEEYVLDV